jgi:antitoxin VapB
MSERCSDRTNKDVWVSVSPPGTAQHAEARRTAALARVRAVGRDAGVAGVVLTRPGPVAWAGGGINPPIDRTAATDTVWIAVGPDRWSVITTGVEAPRLVAELVPADVEVIAVPWWDADALVTAAAAAIGAAPDAIGADGDPRFGRDLDRALAAARLPLSAAEQAALRSLGLDAAAAVEGALRTWRPGEPDVAIAARIVAAIERAGGDAPCVLVGGDERLARFRHPVANGDRPTTTVMAVLVARRGGLHVALTRHAATAAAPQLAAGLAACRRIHRSVLAAAVPGATYGDLLQALAAGYATAGHADGWQEHYQGGPIGFGQREFEIAPVQTDSPWFAEELAVGVALAFNPSLPGGAKDEDTYLLGHDGLELVTTTGEWPVADDDPRRPGVLLVAS